MLRFIIGALCGAALTYSVMSHPKEAKSALQSGAHTVATAVASGAAEGAKALDKSLSDDSPKKK
jgi:hypothetical protein